MKRLPLFAVLLLIPHAGVVAQESAAGGQATVLADASTTPTAADPNAPTPTLAPSPAPAGAATTNAPAAQAPADATGASTTPPAANETAAPFPNLTPTPAPTTAGQPSGLLTPPPDITPGTPAPAGVSPSASATTTAVTPPPPGPGSRTRTMSRREIARIQQQEVIRRQDLIFRANQAMDVARRSELATDYPIARQNYLFAAQAFGSISRSTASYARAAEGLTRVDFALYDETLRLGDTHRAKQLIDEVVEYNPHDRVALERQAKVNHALANPNDTTLYGNIAITPGFVNRVNEIQGLFIQAEQFRRTGQWDNAEASLKRILGFDPYNIAATKQLERIIAEKNKYAETARLETRDERLRQVEEKWYAPIENRDITTQAEEAQPAISRRTNFGLEQKLNNIFLSLDFTGASIEEATSSLSSESKRLDPDHKGVNFIILPEASASAKAVSLTLNNVPLAEALRYVCQLANVKYKVQDYAISIVPFNENTDDLISRTFNVQPSFLTNAPTGDTAVASATTIFTRRPISSLLPGATPTAAAAPETAQTALEAKGVKFPPGGSAVYTASTGQLTVVDTADQMELVEELVNAGEAPTIMVRIATKFVEINQTDLNDLTLNTAFNLFANGVTTSGLQTSSPLTGSSFATALPGALGVAPDSIDTLISPAANTFNTVGFRGFLSGFQYNLALNALSQKKSADLLEDPAVLVKSGEQGTLEAIRIFPYPISFDPPVLVAQNNTSTTVSVTNVINPPVVIATTPTDFKRRNVGVRLVVKPQVASDDKTINLSLFPEVTEFDGFINYGSVINIGNPDGTTSLLSTNVINQPVFDTRRINTQVLIRDGSTVVLGGLLNDNLQTVNDRVPILGDIPLIGRLFQSKAMEDIKRNLIIFVTANIYRNDGELLNPPELVNAADILTGHNNFSPAPPPAQ